MTLIILILVAITGLLLIALDLFFIPGGVVAFVGLLFLIYADYEAYQSLGTAYGHAFTLVTFLVSGFFIYLMFKPSFWKRVSQVDVIEAKVNIDDLVNVKIGDIGIVKSRLRPSGMVLFGDYEAEATAPNQMIEPGTQVQVIETTSNQIIVKPLN